MFKETRATREGGNTSTRWAALALSASALAFAAAPASAQTAQPAPTPAPEEASDEGEAIVVTGTILRGNATSVSPVGVLTADDLAARGQTTVAETLQTLSGNAGGSLPNAFTGNGAFAAGASAVSLRGLLTSNTLMLFDGTRVAYYPLADDATRNFVDANTIPQAVIERVETLKDGASSTYGADAIAGVINLITRREFNGLDVDYSEGWRSSGDGADQRHFSAIWGHGDLGSDGFNVYLAAEYQSDDYLWNRDVSDQWSTSDQSNVCGNSIDPTPLDNSGVQDGITCRTNGIVYGVQFNDFFPNVNIASRNFGSTVAFARPYNAANTAAVGDFRLLNPAAGCGSLTPATITTAQATNPVTGVVSNGFSSNVDVCQQDLVNDYGMVSPESERISFSGRMTFNVGDRAEMYLMGNYYQNEVNTVGIPVPVQQQLTTPAESGVTVNTDNLYLPIYVCPTGSVTHECVVGDPGATLNPNNPWASLNQVARIYYRVGDIPLTTNYFSQSFRAAGGLTGDFDMMGQEYRYDLSLSASQVNLEVLQAGRLYYPNLMAAIRQGTYNFMNPSLNTDAVRQFVAPDNIQNSVSKLIQFNANASTDLFELPGGVAEIGAGLSVRYESVDNPSANDDLNGAANRYFVINPFGATGSRDVESLAFELALPFTEQIDVNLSGRYDTYSTGQSNFSPKIGARFRPFDMLTLRGTWSQGFRIPSFAESFAVPSTGFTTVTPDTDWCNTFHGDAATNPYCAAYGEGHTQVSSPDLQPETSENLNLGFILRPVSNWTFSADWYRITQEDVIGALDYQQAVDAYYAGDPIPAGFEVVLDAVDPLFPGAPARIQFIRYGLDNLGTRETSGWDLQLTGSFDFDGIEWITSGEATYVESLTQEFPGGGEQEYAGTIGPFVITAASGTPQWRLNWQNTIDFGRASITATAYWTEGYLSVAEDNGGTAGDDTCLSGVGSGTPATYRDLQTPVVCKVDDSFYIDLHGQFDATEGLQLYVDVANVLDEDPAYDPTTYGSFNYNPAWGVPGIVGRFISIGARARF